MIDLEAAGPFDTADPRHEPFLRKLQGNILKGHGRDYTVNLFLRFRVDGERLRRFLADLSGEYVTSAWDQLRESVDYRRYGLPGALFGNLFLTRHAYERLHLADQAAAWFADPPRDADPDVPQRATFLEGMRAAADDLGDAVPAGATEPLERAYLEKAIDALLLLADDSEEHVTREARRAMAWFERLDLADVVAVEIGRALRNAQGQGIEHFGYVDGRSQPLFLDIDFAPPAGGAPFGPGWRERTDDTRISRETGAFDVWSPLAPLSLVLVEDRGAGEADAYGSFYVFRKLEQDVMRFCMAEQQLADALGLQGRARARAGAMVVGRFRDGTPLALSETDGFSPAQANNFRYDELDAALGSRPEGATDPWGLKCPFHAHIRKVNPRQSRHAAGESAQQIAERDRRERGRRIVRRGITYGQRTMTNGLAAISDLPSGGVGLLFACFQASIRNQFAFVQRNWVDRVTFPIAGSAFSGQDPLLGRATDSVFAQRWRREYGGRLATAPAELGGVDLRTSHDRPFLFSDFVTFRGGEFFFAPSLPFLRNGRQT
jgi:Dyp-type peroxidase family